MKIAVLGAGAMGCIYGGYLSQNNEVWLIDVWKEHVDMINAKGLRIAEDKEEYLFNPKASYNAKEVGNVDLLILFVKSINTEEALLGNKALLGENTLVLSLQNGYGNYEDIHKYVKKENIIIGVTLHGANVLGPGHIQHAGVGMSYVGTRDNDDLNNAKLVSNTLQKSSIECEISNNIMRKIWAKLISNSAGNAITALLNVPNGFIVDNPDTLSLLHEIVNEGVNVAAKDGVQFDIQDAIQVPMNGFKATGMNRSSMLQDVSKKRKTEIERINGAIVSKGLEYGIATPYNDCITRLIKALEATYLGK